MNLSNIKTHSAFIWSIAETLRGDFKRFEYGKVILPFVILRRLDCLLENSKENVLKTSNLLPQEIDERAKEQILFDAVGNNIKVYNLSQFTFKTLDKQKPEDIHANLIDYITNFSSDIRDIFLDKFLFIDQLKRLKEADLLYKVFHQFTEINLHPDSLSNLEMGYLFEELIRRFSEISNETAGEHYTPREVIKLIVSLLINEDKEFLTNSGVIRQIYDPAAGTGGMLTIAEMEMKAINPKMRIELFGQELNPESYAICKSDMLITEHNPENIAFGNTLIKDAHKTKKFHYMLSNPPYGVDWKKYKKPIQDEFKDLGMEGRFGAGLPRISDGQLLFLQHMISKMRNDDNGSRIGVVTNGSPLFSGSAGSGESEIRRWMFENDLIEAIISLPTDLFYNTGIQTYIWLLTNKKSESRKNKVQLINASGKSFWQLLRKSLGKKKKEIPLNSIREIINIYSEEFSENNSLSKFSKTFDVSEFGYREIRVERPLKLSFSINGNKLEELKLSKPFRKLNDSEQKEIIETLLNKLSEKKIWDDRNIFVNLIDNIFKAADIKLSNTVRKAIITSLSHRSENANYCRDKKGHKEPDPLLRDHEMVPFCEKWESFFEREVKQYMSDAWVDQSYKDSTDHKVGRIGYEINFSRYFYEYVAPRPINETLQELKILEEEIGSIFMKINS